MNKSYVLILCLCFQHIMAGSITVDIITTENNTPIGPIKFEDTDYGLLITPALTLMSPGLHGLHIHQNPSCANFGKAAGGHLDSLKTNKHLGPYQAGHLGDLPVLYVDQSGSATSVILAPKLKAKDITNRSIMIHQDGDNYSDKPLPLGGGNARVACGVITSQK